MPACLADTQDGFVNHGIEDEPSAKISLQGSASGLIVTEIQPS